MKVILFVSILISISFLDNDIEKIKMACPVVNGCSERMSASQLMKNPNRLTYLRIQSALNASLTSPIKGEYDYDKKNKIGMIYGDSIKIMLFPVSSNLSGNRAISEKEEIGKLDDTFLDIKVLINEKLVNPESLFDCIECH